MYRLDDIVQPPASHDVLRTRYGIIADLSAATFVAGLLFIAILAVAGWASLAWLALGAVAPAVLALLVVAAAYYAIGIMLCARFMSRLPLWGGASLAHVVNAKTDFVRRWPVESTRLLRALILHRMTGGGLPPAYPDRVLRD